VSVAFRFAQAVVVVLTPDDEARLLPELHGSDEPPHEVGFMGQARPNVLFEAGMALASHPDRTIFVEIGKVRPFSDVAGRHMVRLTGAAATLQAVATRLGNAGCPVNLTGSGWLDESRFKDLDAHSRRAGPVGMQWRLIATMGCRLNKPALSATVVNVGCIPVAGSSAL